MVNHLDEQVCFLEFILRCLHNGIAYEDNLMCVFGNDITLVHACTYLTYAYCSTGDGKSICSHTWWEYSVVSCSKIISNISLLIIIQAPIFKMHCTIGPAIWHIGNWYVYQWAHSRRKSPGGFILPTATVHLVWSPPLERQKMKKTERHAVNTPSAICLPRQNWLTRFEWLILTTPLPAVS